MLYGEIFKILIIINYYKVDKNIYETRIKYPIILVKNS